MPNYTEINCPSCNRIVRSTDRFCIFCGGRMSGNTAPAPSKQIPEQEKKQLEQEVQNDLNANQKETLEKESKKTKTEPKTPSSLDDLLAEMPPEIRDQLEAKMNLALINERKKKLKKTLADLSKQAEDEKYEYDVDFMNLVNTKLEAVKQVKDELNQEEEKWRATMGERFKVDELMDKLEEKKQQLLELKRSFKLHEIKKDVYEQLKTEYINQFNQIQTELEKLRINIIRWVSLEKANRNKLDGKIRMAQARMKSGEIDKNEFEKERDTLQKEIEKSEQKIKILEHYTKEKEKKFF